MGRKLRQQHIVKNNHLPVIESQDLTNMAKAFLMRSFSVYKILLTPRYSFRWYDIWVNSTSMRRRPDSINFGLGKATRTFDSQKFQWKRLRALTMHVHEIPWAPCPISIHAHVPVRRRTHSGFDWKPNPGTFKSTGILDHNTLWNTVQMHMCWDHIVQRLEYSDQNNASTHIWSDEPTLQAGYGFMVSEMQSAKRILTTIDAVPTARWI